MKRLFQILHITGFFLLVFIIYKADWQIFFKTINKISILYFILIAIFTCSLELFKAERFRILLRQENLYLNFKKSTLIYLGTEFWGNITPARTGEFYRMKYIHIPLSKRFIYIAGDRGFDFFTIFFFSLISLFYYYNNYIYIYAAIFLFLFLLIFFIFIRNTKSQKIHQWLKKVNLDSILKNWNFKNVVYMIFLSILSTIQFYIMNFMVFDMLQIDLPLNIIILNVNIVCLTNILPITFSGLGTREFITFNLLKSFGYSYSHALIYGVFSFIFQMVISSVFSFIIWIYLEKNKRSILF